MNWNSPAEFFAMGGYGFYVWGAYVVTLALMLAEPLLARRRHRRALAEVTDAADARDAADVAHAANAANAVDAANDGSRA